MSVAINILGLPGKPNTELRVLGVQVSPKLKWGPHIKLTCERARQQSASLTRLVGSTWGASFARARNIYTAVVRPKITNACSVWNSPQGLDGASKSTLKKLEKFQNQCLRSISGAYKTTKLSVLEHEAGISPLETYLNYLTLAYDTRRGPQKPTSCGHKRLWEDSTSAGNTTTWVKENKGDREEKITSATSKTAPRTELQA